GPNAIFDVSSGLGLRDVDRNNDWSSDIRCRYPDLDSVDLSNFVQQSRFEDTVSVENLNVDYHTLNDKQMTIFKRIESHYSNFVRNHNKVDPLRVIIMGTAGTGKSYLINAIRVRLQEMAINNGIKTSPMIVVAPTGVAAF